MKHLIIFLVRRRLGLKKNEGFQFTNQKSDNEYYMFTDKCIVKIIAHKKTGRLSSCVSNVSLNWLLNDGCEIRKVYFDDSSLEIKSIEN